MGKLQSIIERELDPRHDFDRVGYLSGSGRILEDFYFLANTSKHFARGFAVGAGIGALGFYLAGDNPKTGAVVLSSLGPCIDASQYWVRGALIPMVRETCKLMNPDYNTIRGFLKKQRAKAS